VNNQLGVLNHDGILTIDMDFPFPFP